MGAHEVGSWLCCDLTTNTRALKPHPNPISSGKLVIRDYDEAIVLRARHILIDNGGELHAGSALCPFQGNFSIILYGRWVGSFLGSNAALGFGEEASQRREGGKRARGPCSREFSLPQDGITSETPLVIWASWRGAQGNSFMWTMSALESQGPASLLVSWLREPLSVYK